MKLKYRQFILNLIQQCVDKIKSYEKVNELRFSAELAIEIAKFINKSVLESDGIKESKIDRSEVLLNAFNQVFVYTDDELKSFESNIIEFLIDRKFITKIKLSRKVMKSIRKPLKFFLKIVGITV
jgi:translation initiation factor 2B subunit (eIF-2B alpha/beta/delta family)